MTQVEMTRDREEFLRASYETVTDAVKHIARVRRMLELENDDMEKFDKALNDACTEWHEYYSDMSKGDMVIEGLLQMAKDGEVERLADILGRKED